MQKKIRKAIGIVCCVLALAMAETAVAATWFSETFESAVVGTTVVVGNGNTLTGDRVWACQNSWENPTSAGPSLEVKQDGGSKYLWQAATAGGKGEMLVTGLPVLDITQQSVTVQFDFKTGSTIDSTKRKWYVFVGEAVDGFSYRIKAQARKKSGAESIEIDFFASPIGEGGEQNFKATQAMQTNKTYRITVTFIRNAAVGTTDVLYHVVDLATSQDLVPEGMASLPGIVAANLCQFDAVKVAACDEAALTGIDNVLVTSENLNPPAAPSTKWAQIGDSMCFEVPVEGATGISWNFTHKEGETVALGVTTAELCLEKLDITDSGSYWTYYDDGSKTIHLYKVNLDVFEALPVAGMAGFSVLLCGLTMAGIAAVRKRRSLK